MNGFVGYKIISALVVAILWGKKHDSDWILWNSKKKEIIQLYFVDLIGLIINIYC